MGLDAVEVMMEIEDQLGVSIPDEEASDTRTVGDLIACVQRHYQRETSDQRYLIHAFGAFRTALLQELPLQRREIRPSTPLARLIPKRHRRRVWSHLKQHGLPLPHLRLHPWAAVAVGCLVIAAAVTLARLMHNQWGILTVVPIGMVAYLLTRPLAVELPYSVATAGLAARLLIRENTELPQRSDLSRRSVSELVRAIVADVACVPLGNVHEETTWAELRF